MAFAVVVDSSSLPARGDAPHTQRRGRPQQRKVLRDKVVGEVGANGRLAHGFHVAPDPARSAR
jgi:hypothetical protein